MKVRTTGSRRPMRTVIAAVLIEEVGHAVQVVMAHQNPAAIALHQWAAASCADPVGDDGAEIAADGPRRCCPNQIEAIEVHQVAGERHDDFGWKRDARRLDSHEQSDACVAAHVDDVRDELNKDCENAFCHGPGSSI